MTCKCNGKCKVCKCRFAEIVCINGLFAVTRMVKDVNGWKALNTLYYENEKIAKERRNQWLNLTCRFE